MMLDINTERLQIRRQSIGRASALIFATARSMRDEGCRNNRGVDGEGVGGWMRERNALPIDYLTHISTSDL